MYMELGHVCHGNFWVSGDNTINIYLTGMFVGKKKDI